MATHDRSFDPVPPRTGVLPFSEAMLDDCERDERINPAEPATLTPEDLDAAEAAVWGGRAHSGGMLPPGPDERVVNLGGGTPTLLLRHDGGGDFTVKLMQGDELVVVVAGGRYHLLRELGETIHFTFDDRATADQFAQSVREATEPWGMRAARAILRQGWGRGRD